MNKILGYFKGVGQEARRIKWPKRNELFTAIAVVLIITAFAAVFLILEIYASEILVAQLRQAFESIR